MEEDKSMIFLKYKGKDFGIFSLVFSWIIIKCEDEKRYF